jgi:hypothetical protein
MTLEGIHAIYDDAYRAYQIKPVNGWSAEKAELYALRRVVEALRDEIVSRTVRNQLNEILASDGVKAEYTGGMNDLNVTPAAAPVCEWTLDDHPDYGGHYDTACGDAWNGINGSPREDGYKFCPSCGLPISFKSEVAR